VGGPLVYRAACSSAVQAPTLRISVLAHGLLIAPTGAVALENGLAREPGRWAWRTPEHLRVQNSSENPGQAEHHLLVSSGDEEDGAYTTVQPGTRSWHDHDGIGAGNLSRYRAVPERAEGARRIASTRAALKIRHHEDAGAWIDLSQHYPQSLGHDEQERDRTFDSWRRLDYLRYALNKHPRQRKTRKSTSRSYTAMRDAAWTGTGRRSPTSICEWGEFDRGELRRAANNRDTSAHTGEHHSNTRGVAGITCSTQRT